MNSGTKIHWFLPIELYAGIFQINRFHLKCLPNPNNKISGFFFSTLNNNDSSNLLVLPLNVSVWSIQARERNVKLSEKVVRRLVVAVSGVPTLINKKSNFLRV